VSVPAIDTLPLADMSPTTILGVPLSPVALPVNAPLNVVADNVFVPELYDNSASVAAVVIVPLVKLVRTTL